jgi:hypothetical protein
LHSQIVVVGAWQNLAAGGLSKPHLAQEGGNAAPLDAKLRGRLIVGVTTRTTHFPILSKIHITIRSVFLMASLKHEDRFGSRESIEQLGSARKWLGYSIGRHPAGWIVSAKSSD